MLTYEDVGVSIERNNTLVERIKKFAPLIGGFSGLFDLSETKYKIAVSTDGVGSKLDLAIKYKKYDTIGIDLVAMSVNDIICCGAKPIAFLDYFACNKIDVEVAEAVIRGIQDGCEEAGCLLIGGETAELGNKYKEGDFDLAGFAVGIVEKGKEINGSKIWEGDVVLGLPSSGLHSNGFTLAREVLKDYEKCHLEDMLTPTKIYVHDIMGIISRYGNRIRGISHVTGGGIPENLGRIIPNGLKAVIHYDWNEPEIFKVIEHTGQVSWDEMFKVFNMGIGMIIVVDREVASSIEISANAVRIGYITTDTGDMNKVIITEE